MGNFLLDTNMCIYCLDGNPKAIKYLGEIADDPRNKLLLSVVTEAELFSSPKVYGNADLQAEITAFIEGTDGVMEITREIAATAGEIRAYFQQELGRKIKLPDAFIAATAIRLNAALISNNDKDFVDVLSRYGTPYHNPVRHSL